MSFKRDGNDSGLLLTLQKRRINDLLAENIPEDEAKLLANGRFTCLVCSSRPIFDTVNMLSVHRRGNKHKASTEFHEKKKEELRVLIAKRKHDQFIKTGSPDINVCSPEYSGLSTSSPYDSRVKRPKTKFGDRKLRVTLQKDVDHDVDSQGVNDSPNSSLWQRICEQQQHGPVKHQSQLKNITCGNNELPLRLQPYSSKHKRTASTFSYDVIKNSGGTKSQNDPSSWDLKSKTFGAHCSPRVSQSLASPTMSFAHSALPPPPPPPPPSHQPLLPPSSKSSQTSLVSKSDEAAEAQKSVSQKYHLLQGSGWKRDWDGKWIKDDQAEFDSDEEAPDLP